MFIEPFPPEVAIDPSLSPLGKIAAASDVRLRVSPERGVKVATGRSQKSGLPAADILQED
ncbi:hypothetical protein GCM10009099_32150 [Caenispirillum bisanense]